MIVKESKLRIVDNTGAKIIKCIGTYKFNQLAKKVGSIFMGSLNRVMPRRRLKKGSLFRAFTVRVRFLVFRPEGLYLASSSNKVVLFKNLDNLPVANRIKGFLMLEVFYNPQIQFPNLTVYVL